MANTMDAPSARPGSTTGRAFETFVLTDGGDTALNVDTKATYADDRAVVVEVPLLVPPGIAGLYLQGSARDRIMARGRWARGMRALSGGFCRAPRQFTIRLELTSALSQVCG